MLNFAGANSMRQSAKSAVCGGVGIAANHGHAWQCGAIFWANDMHNALTLGHEGEEGGRAKLGNVAVEGGDLFFADGVGDTVVAQLPTGCGGIVIGGGHDGADTPHLAAGLTQALKGLGAGHFVNQMTVDVQDGSAVFFGVDDVFVPNFVVKRTCHGAS